MAANWRQKMPLRLKIRARGLMRYATPVRSSLKMALDLREQIEEMKALLSSAAAEESKKASAYSKLLHLQEISAEDASSAQMLADSSHAIIVSLVPDIFQNDEEIAAQALKCLGFMIYHPLIVASIRDDDANVIIESLVKIIVTTKIKSVCNLGVWCISVQQFSASLLHQHFQSLLRAIIHALDNPIGSLSTTFEAMQAVVKLASLSAEQMRNLSSVWTPPIYRRLVSIDKRDRDMSERCLLKVMPIICPPPVTLSKVLALDMKKKLLSGMKELLDQGMKIQSLQAWRWFIRLLGPYALKNKSMVNEMLKFLEQTFSDIDSQVQIASLVAWEGLIDAFFQPPVQASHSNLSLGNAAQVLRTSEGQKCQIADNRNLKRLKLIMAPLVGIMSSKCDVSVHASCLSTWSYLLYKLKDSASCQLVMKFVWEPIINVVFRVGPVHKNIWFFDFCVNLLDTLILGSNQEATGELCDQETSHLTLKNTVEVRLTSGKCPLRHYPINFAPWELCQLDFFIKIISILVIRESNATVAPEYGRVANDAALRLFQSLLGAVQRALRRPSITYDDVIQCLHTIFKFMGMICKYVTSETSNKCCPRTCLKFLEEVTDKLQPSILESPLYKVGLDLNSAKKIGHDAEVTSATEQGSEEKVLPVAYLSALYFSVVINSCSKESEPESLLHQMQGYLKFLLSSYCTEEVLLVLISLLYKNTTIDCLQIWVVLANCIKDSIDGKEAQTVLELETENIGGSLVLRLLSYPFLSWSSSSMNLNLQIVVEAWKLLYVSIDEATQSSHLPVKSISEDLCAILNGQIDQTTAAVGTGTGLQLDDMNCSVGYSVLCGSVIICILERLTLSINSKGSHNTVCEARKSDIKNCMDLVVRFMKLFWVNKERTEPFFLSVTLRFLSELVNFVRCLQQNEDIVMLIEYTSSPLLEWLSNLHLLDEETNHQLQTLWTQILKALQQCQPPMKFDSSFLKFQAPLLERTLDHQNPAISEPTIDFWNSAYGAQFKLEFPQNLLPLLDKLSRNGKIRLFGKKTIKEKDSMSSLQRYTTLKKCSKRVEILGRPVVNGDHDFDDLYSGSKRRKPELTEHQKEVRRAQQGRASDCNGRGPGVRTYTALDFSQGNEESQDSQDIRDAESILEMLRKV